MLHCMKSCGRFVQRSTHMLEKLNQSFEGLQMIRCINRLQRYSHFILILLQLYLFLKSSQRDTMHKFVTLKFLMRWKGIKRIATFLPLLSTLLHYTTKITCRSISVELRGDKAFENLCRKQRVM